ncbi:MAG: hypothetical protein ABW190_04790 [Rhizobacter sp.]
MELNRFVALEELLSLVRSRADRSIEYSVYWRDGAEDPGLTDEVLVAAPVEVENDRDVFPPIVVKHGYWIYCSDQLIQDVVDVALGQNASVGNERLLEALRHYLRKDNFLDVKADE